MAASWGCFDLQRQEFLYESLKHAGVDTSYLPEVRKGHFLIGKTRDGVPVMGSIGPEFAEKSVKPGSERECNSPIFKHTSRKTSEIPDVFCIFVCH